jgi:hypothetical protein
MLQCKRLAGRVAVLMKGRLAASGQPEEIFDLGQEQLLYEIDAPW